MVTSGKHSCAQPLSPVASHLGAGREPCVSPRRLAAVSRGGARPGPASFALLESRHSFAHCMSQPRNLAAGEAEVGRLPFRGPPGSPGDQVSSIMLLTLRAQPQARQEGVPSLLPTSHRLTPRPPLEVQWCPGTETLQILEAGELASLRHKQQQNFQLRSHNQEVGGRAGIQTQVT